MRIALQQLEDRIAELPPDLRELELVEVTPVIPAPYARQLEAQWQQAEKRLHDIFARLAPGQLRALTLSTGALASGEYEIDAQSDALQTFGDSFVLMASEHPSLVGLRTLVMRDSGLSRAAIPALSKLKELEVLSVGAPALDDKGLAELRRSLPNVRVDILP